MKLASLLVVVSAFLLMFVAGCGSSGPAPAAQQNEIEQYLQENPDSDANMGEDEEFVE